MKWLIRFQYIVGRLHHLIPIDSIIWSRLNSVKTPPAQKGGSPMFHNLVLFRTDLTSQAFPSQWAVAPMAFLRSVRHSWDGWDLDTGCVHDQKGLYGVNHLWLDIWAVWKRHFLNAYPDDPNSPTSCPTMLKNVLCYPLFSTLVHCLFPFCRPSVFLTIRQTDFLLGLLSWLSVYGCMDVICIPL